MKLNNFKEAIEWQRPEKNYVHINPFNTSVDNIDRLQFTVGEVLWLVLADGYYLDDYEESVTQYGITQEGKWAAVYSGHCSCYGWEETTSGDIEYYDSLDILLKADGRAVVILQYWDKLLDIMPFLKQYLRRNSKLFRQYGF